MPAPNEPLARFCAWLRNSTHRPSLLTTGAYEGAFPLPFPFKFTLTRAVVPFCRSRSKTSTALFVSPETRLDAELENTTYRPSLLRDGSAETPAAGEPFVSTLTRLFVPAFRSRTKTSRYPFVSLATRLSASPSKTIYRPFKLMGTPEEIRL